MTLKLKLKIFIRFASFCFFFNGLFEMRVLQIFIFLLSPLFHEQNDTKEIDSLCFEISINLSSLNPPSAIYIVDSIYTQAKSQTRRIHALMIKAEVYKTQERIPAAIETIIQAIELSKEVEDYEHQARLNVHIAKLSREIGFLNEGKKHLNKALEIISTSHNPDKIEAIYALVEKELAEFELEAHNFKKAIRHLNNSKEYHLKNPDRRNSLFHLSQIVEAEGRYFSGIKNYESALVSFKNAETLIKETGSENTLFGALIYKEIGDAYSNLNQKDSAQIYFNQALVIIEKSSHNSLREKMYGRMSQLYREKGIADSSSYYYTKYIDVVRKNKQNRKYTINILAKTLLTNFSAAEEKEEKGRSWIIEGGLIVLFGGFLVLVSSKFNSKSKQINTQKKRSQSPIRPSKETEKKLKQEIKKFENSKKFLNPNITFSLLINYLNTNSKYLNYFLRTYYQKDYNTYINDLRINYIVEKIKTEPKYRNIEIGKLAEKSGFLSHSNFSANFKRVMKYSPSEYIKRTNQKDKEFF